MAKDRIEKNDVISPDINKEIKELNKNLAQSVKLMTELTKASIDLQKNTDPKNLQQVTTAQKESNKLSEESIKVNNERLSTSDKLRQKIKGVSKEEERLKIELQKKRKEIKENIKAEKAQAGSINDLSRKNKILRERIKNVSTETESGQKRIKAYNKAIEKNSEQIKESSDAFTQQKQNIGNYSSALDDLPGALGKASQGTKGLLSSFKTLLANPIGLVLSAIVGALTLLGKAFKRTREGGKTFQKILATIGGWVESVWNSLSQLATSIKNLFGDGGLKGIFKGFGKAAKESFEDVAKNAKIIGDIKKEIIDLKDSIIDLNISMGEEAAKLNSIADLQRAIADDATKSFAEREKAASKARIASESAAKKELLLINEKFKLADLELKVAEESGKFNEDLLNARSEAYIALIESEKNFTLVVRENEKQRTELKQDRLEKDLDILIDGVDAVKTANEKILANEDNTLRERITAFNTIKIELQDSFNEQVKIIEDFASQNVDVNELINESNAKVLNEKIRALGLSEIIEGRLLEIIRERKMALSDLVDAEKELTKVIEEEGIKRLESTFEKNEKELETEEERLDNISELQIEKLQERNDAEKELLDENIANQQAADEAKKESFKSYVVFATAQAQQLANSIFAFQSQELANQLTMDVEKAKARGASEAEIREIEKKAAKDRQNLAVKQALINGALGITNAIATAPNIIVGLILAAVVAGITALNIASIKSQSFAKGIKDSGNEWLNATVGEKGTERINFADGRSMLTPNGSTQMFLPPHSEVVPNHRLQRDLAEMQMVGMRKSSYQDEEQKRKEEHKELIKAIKNRDETTINITEGGFSVIARKGNNFSKYLDRKYRS